MLFHLPGRKIIIHALFIFSLAGVLIFTGLRDYFLSPARKGASDQIFFVFEGSTLSKIASELETKEIINRKSLFLICARLTGYGRNIKAGEYRLSAGMPPFMILDILNKGAIVIHKVTLPEGFTREQIGAALEKEGLINKDEFLKFTGNSEVATSYGISVPNLEGFLYPDTYQLRWGLTTKSVINMLVGQFWKVVNPLRDRIQELGLTVEQVIILASIVEKETGRPEERPLVASVFLNRLKMGNRLESDPTVIYGMNHFNGNLTKGDLLRYTPYNTYVIEGLPPGAIANPGREAILAILFPADTGYLYFVSKNDGSHYFSKTLSEHKQAVEIYQKNNHQGSGRGTKNAPENTGGSPMPNSSVADYSSLDHPEILALLFHPRPDWRVPAHRENVEELSISVEGSISLGAKLHCADKSAPVILFFHGNGEIVSDYDDLGPVYTKMGINFLPVDYRGYGRSTGSPTVTGMMRDCHAIFKYIKQWLKETGYSGPIIIMGRSLGSASALELGAHYESEIDGLIIESGFADVLPLLRLLGVNIQRLGISKKDHIGNIDKIRGFHKPVLIIHAEHDHIIPFSNGQSLFDACPSFSKRFLKIPGADHNSIFAVGMERYLEEVKRLAEDLVK